MADFAYAGGRELSISDCDVIQWVVVLPLGVSSLLTPQAVFRALTAHRARDVFNPWRQRDRLDTEPDAPLRRLRRLALHFECRPKLLLIGEACGYQGCRFSGIPFTSERLLLLQYIPRVACVQRISRRVRPWSEPSATTVWKVMHELGVADRVILWNSFPWHPHGPGEPHSNRRPTAAEVEQGKPILEAVLRRFECATVVAVGQVARASLRQLLGRDPLTVRHPSMAGVSAFRSGVAAIVRRRGWWPRGAKR
jgi:uracil-DNA glycosylase